MDVHKEQWPRLGQLKQQFWMMGAYAPDQLAGSALNTAVRPLALAWPHLMQSSPAHFQHSTALAFLPS